MVLKEADEVLLMIAWGKEFHRGIYYNTNKTNICASVLAKVT